MTMERNLTHGGDWAGFEARHGGKPLDFSANISPLGLPEGVREAVAASLDTADRYPDPLCRALRSAIGEAEGVDPAWVLCGSGAADLIYRNTRRRWIWPGAGRIAFSSGRRTVLGWTNVFQGQ